MLLCPAFLTYNLRYPSCIIYTHFQTYARPPHDLKTVLVKTLPHGFFPLFQSILPRGCPRNILVLLYLTLFDGHDAFSVLRVRLIKGLLLKHDFLAFKLHCRTRFVHRNRWVKLRSMARRVHLSMRWHYVYLNKTMLRKKCGTRKGYALPSVSEMLLHPARLHCTDVPAHVAGCRRYRGGGRRVSLFPYALLKDHIVDKGNSSDRHVSARYKFVDHVGDVDLLKYASETYVHAALPLDQLLSVLPKAQAQGVARVHNLHVSARSNSATLAASMATGHCCPQCTSHVSVFSTEPSKTEISNARSRNHRKQKPQAQGLDLEDFPPEPLDRSLRDKILSSACKKMSPDSFEEGGCAVCGELKPSRDLSRLKSIKNQLHVLSATGVTRTERKKAGDPICEFTGPVLDYNCSHVCNDCRGGLYCPPQDLIRSGQN